MKNAIFPAAIAVLLVLTCSASGEQPAETLPGFKPNNLLESRGIDNVNLFTGDPGVVVPLGPEYALGAGYSWQLKAYNSAKFWKFDAECLYEGIHHAYVAGYPTIGAGWTLELGYITTDEALAYRSPDGGTHRAYSAGGAPYFTTDGTNLRVTPLGGSYTVEFPDGTIHTFGHQYNRPHQLGGPTSYDFNDLVWGVPGSVRYGLTSISNRFGQSLLEVDYMGANDWRVSRIKLTPTITPGRDIVYSWGTRTVNGVTWDALEWIDFPSISGRLLRATFAYNLSGFERNIYDNSTLGQCFTNGNASVPLLAGITLSGPTLSPLSYGFLYQHTDPERIRVGVLTRVTLPTGGTIDYTYAPTTSTCFGPNCADLELTSGEFGPGEAPATPELQDASRFWDSSPGVVTRTENDLVNPSSTVTYYRFQHVPYDVFFQPDETRITRRTIVTEPSGNGAAQDATKYLFHADTEPDSAASGIEIARRYYSNEDASATPVRAIVNCHEGDYGGPTCGYRDGSGNLQAYLLGANVRRQKQVTWYGANPTGGGTCVGTSPPCTATENSNYHASARKYGMTSATSTLPNSPARTVTTTWTPETGPWLLDLYSYRKEEEGFSTVEQYFDFDSTNGFLRGSVTDDDPLDPTDRILFNCRYPETDPANLGSPKSEFSATASYDLQIPANACLNAYPSLPDGVIGTNNDAFGRQHTYQRGLPKTTQWLRWNGSTNAPMTPSWLSFDVTRDPNTDWVTSSRDTAAVQTSYSYDELGRLTGTTPPSGESATTITYDLPRQTTVIRAGGDAWERYIYDGLGRLVREIRQMPTGYSVRLRRYDAAGHASFLSEWGPCTTPTGDCLTTSPPGNTSSNFDPFGRPQLFARADGTTTSTSYADGSVAFSDSKKSVTVNNLCVGGPGCPGGTSATTDYLFDAHGRLVSVVEPGSVATTYSYDVSNNVVSVGQGSQVRSFARDRLGFLRSETTPEKGTVLYTAYGSLGNLRRKTEGGAIVNSYLYDAAGRVACEIGGPVGDSDTCDTPGLKIFVRNFYDGNGFAGGASPLGKLTRRIGENPGKPSTVTEDFTYSGIGGRVSQEATTLTGTPFGSLTFTQNWTYNGLGLVATHTHPRASGDSAITASMTYSFGLPTRVVAGSDVFVDTASYNPSGGLGSWRSGSSLTTTITQDSSLLPRPLRIATSPGSVFATGDYIYDGAGNIRTIGPDTYYYDAVSRLVQATVSGQQQSFSYDRWGNRDPSLVDPNTNRRLSTGYDGRGNLVADVGRSYSYDAFSRQTSASSERYLYDGAGERIARVTGGQQFYTITPCRVKDTREPAPGQALDPNSPLIVDVINVCGIPPGAASIAGNLTAISPPDTGLLTLSSADSSPLTSTLNFNSGVTRANNFVVGLSAGGQLRLASTSVLHAAIDISGYFLSPTNLETWTVTLRDEANRISTEYTVTSSGRTRKKDFHYLGNLLAATKDNASTKLYYSSDHLGTPRLVTNQSQQTIETHKYLPFGEEIGGTFGNQPLKFAAMERDVSSGNDYVHARYQSSGLARFLSPDVLGGKPEDPQTWNRYAYARNNPIKFVDANGLEFGYPGQQQDLERGIALAHLAQFSPEIAAGAYGQQETPLQNSILGIENFIGLGVAGLAKGIVARPVAGLADDAIRFTQDSVKQTFVRGDLAGKTIQEVAGGLRSGAIRPEAVPINVIKRDGVTYALNNRSLMAVRQAGVNPVLRDVTGKKFFERQLDRRLLELQRKKVLIRDVTDITIR